MVTTLRAGAEYAGVPVQNCMLIAGGQSGLEHQPLRRRLRRSAHQSHFTGQRHCRRQGTPSTHVLVHHQGTSLTITRS
ncbi:hypothetical protein MKW98_012982 [Papaver atlanticum]|uniref:Uncharacterized protein n=1 Tax=Papaver atlanticum TaxID=357466 RepID=A0AAD4XGC4_9MAGN|nr:hypothetical protein MKW98_012982 [Papaver atlanticum]